MTKFLLYGQSGNPDRKVRALAPGNVIGSLRSGRIEMGSPFVRLWTPGSPSALSPLDVQSFRVKVGEWARSWNGRGVMPVLFLNHENYKTENNWSGAMHALEFLANSDVDVAVEYTSYPNFYKIPRWSRDVAPLLRAVGGVARAQAYLAPGKAASNRALNGTYGARYVVERCPRMIKDICDDAGVGWALDVGFHHTGNGRTKALALFLSQLAVVNSWSLGAQRQFVVAWSSAWLSSPAVNGATTETIQQFFKTWEQPLHGRPRGRVEGRAWDEARMSYLSRWVKDSKERA